MSIDPENQHWLRRMFERATNGLSYLESLIHKNLAEADYPLVLLDLTEIDLSDNQLTLLPNEISAFTNLRKLYLHNNQLTELPEEIVELNNLTTLAIYNNPNLTLTNNQKKWLEDLETNGCTLYTDTPDITVKTVKQEPIPNLDDWMEAEKNRFIQTKAND